MTHEGQSTQNHFTTEFIQQEQDLALCELEPYIFSGWLIFLEIDGMIFLHSVGKQTFLSQN